PRRSSANSARSRMTEHRRWGDPGGVPGREEPSLTETAHAPTLPLDHVRLPPSEMVRAARAFADRMAGRRSVRDFSPEPVPDGVLEAAIRAAATAPSGANIQPW